MLVTTIFLVTKTLVMKLVEKLTKKFKKVNVDVKVSLSYSFFVFK